MVFFLLFGGIRLVLMNLSHKNVQVFKYNVINGANNTLNSNFVIFAYCLACNLRAKTASINKHINTK